MSTNRHKSRTLHVTGWLWCGRQAEHEYPLDDAQRITSIRDAQRIAGDFESLSSAEIITTDRLIVEQVATEVLA